MNVFLKLLVAIALLLFSQHVHAQSNPITTISVGSVLASANDTIYVPVSAKNFTNVESMQYAHNWDAGGLIFVSIRTVALKNKGNFDYSSLVAGRCIVLFESLAGGLNVPLTLPDNAVLYELCFVVTGNIPKINILTNGIGLPPATPPGIYNNNGNDLFSAAANVIGTACIVANPFIMTVGNGTAAVGDTICVPVTAKNYTDIVAMQYTHSWNPNSLKFISIKNNILANSGNFSYNLQSAGQCVIFFEYLFMPPNISGLTLPDSTVLYELCFVATGSATSVVVKTGGEGLPPSSPPSVENNLGQNVFLPNFNISGIIFIQQPLFVLHVGSGTALLSDTICVPVWSENFNDIAGMQYVHNWDPIGLELVNIKNGILANIGDFDDNSNLPGRAIIYFEDVSFPIGITLPDSVVLYELCFLATGNMPKIVVATNGVGMPPASPAAVENNLGQNVFSTDLNVSGVICVESAPTIIRVGSDTVTVGDTICVPVFAQNLTDIAGMQYAHSWDNTQLELLQVQPGVLKDYGVLDNNINSSGFCIVIFDILPSIQFGITLPDTAVLYELCFKVKGNGPKTSILTNGTGMAPTSPPAIENGGGINSFNAALNIPGVICIMPPSSTYQPDNVQYIKANPNPFDQMLVFENTSNRTQDMVLYSALGERILSKTLPMGMQSVETGYLPSGMYYWQVLEEGRAVGTGKLVKK
jgi:hypothetical protein